MRRIFVFTNISLDGYFEAPGHDISWTTQDFEAFSAGADENVDTMLFGRRTYEMMSSFWPTLQAQQMLPDVAEFMNARQKVVASRHPFTPTWQNTTVISGDVPATVRELKAQPGGAIAMFGSNALVVSLMEAGLIDELQIMVNPIAIGQGTSLFTGLTRHVKLDRVAVREYRSGNVLLTYKPLAG